MNYVGLVSYIKVTKESKDFFFKISYKLNSCDAREEIRPILSETYYKNLMMKNHRKKRFDAYPYEEANEYLQSVIDKIENGDRRRVYWWRIY